MFEIYPLRKRWRKVTFVGKITVTLRDATERRLREYVTTHYPEKPYGKLSLVVEESVKEYLDRKRQTKE